MFEHTLRIQHKLIRSRVRVLTLSSNKGLRQDFEAQQLHDDLRNLAIWDWKHDIENAKVRERCHNPASHIDVHVHVNLRIIEVVSMGAVCCNPEEATASIGEAAPRFAPKQLLH